MKLTFRIWLLGVFIAASLAAIINVGSATSALIFLLLVGVLFALSFFESKVSAVFVSILLILIAAFVVSSSFQTGVLIKGVDKNSSAFEEGLRTGQIIKSINGKTILNQADFSRVLSETFTDNSTQKLQISTLSGEVIIFTNSIPKIEVEDITKTRLKMGLDLRGGARALVQPNATLTDSQMNDLIEVSSTRFNVFGLSDVQIRGVTDSFGNKFMRVEVAGATPNDLESLISQQGKFEAKVGNTSVFVGGKGDISSVCRNDASCSGITQCSLSQDGNYYCNFRFTLYLTEVAAKRHAQVTQNIAADETGRYLKDKLYLYVDDQEVDSLLIGIDLKGQTTTQISIQGSGSGKSREDAFKNANENMKKLQTVLITGSLPYKLNIVKLDTISPTLGSQFISLLLIAAVSSLVVVSIIIFIRYRRVKASLALLLTSFSELIIILGVAAAIKWNLDLPSIAGILATIGTGVDSQIVILDEARKSASLNIKERIARALFIIFSTYATALASLLPLGWAGAGLFKGFAITTIIGVTAGVFLSRPAFADMIKKIEE